MKPQTLFLCLVFLLLWGADEALAASWLPHLEQPASADQEVFPLALRYREQILDQTILSPVPLLPDALCALPTAAPGLDGCPQGMSLLSGRTTLVYLLMSLRC